LSHAWIWENTVDHPATKSVEFLSGTSPGEIPFNQATRFELALNVKNAKSLGLEFPTTLLGSADLIVE
jgi:putative ABC transport system substrate-binding protein